MACDAYAELHCHSNFSFLDGASHPEELAEEAARLGLAALAITDHDGFYGVVRFAEAARDVGLPTVFGAELTLERRASSRTALADPPGEHLVVLAQGPVGYAAPGARDQRARSSRGRRARRARRWPSSRPRRARPCSSTATRRAARNDAWFVLTGCRKGTVPAALQRDGPAAAERALRELVDAFGRDRVLVELWDHGDPLDRHRNDALAQIALRAGCRGDRDQQRALRDARAPAAGDRARRGARPPLARRDRRLVAGRAVRAPAQRRPSRRAGSRAGRARWSAPSRSPGACAFDLKLAAPELPDYPVPDGHTEMTWLRELVRRGAAVYYPATHPQYDAGACARSTTS